MNLMLFGEISFELIVVIAFLIGILLTMIQAIIGATMFDRVVSIDALTALAVGVLGFFALIYDQAIFLDVALVYAIIAFIGDLAVSKYLEGRGLEE